MCNFPSSTSMAVNISHTFIASIFLQLNHPPKFVKKRHATTERSGGGIYLRRGEFAYYYIAAYTGKELNRDR